MRTEALPSQQEEYNARLNKSLRRLFAAAIALLLAVVAAIVLLYASPPVVVAKPQILGPDGSSLGIAIIISPTAALVYGDLSPGAQVSLHGTDRLALTKIKSAPIANSGTFTLVRVSAPFPPEYVPPSVGMPVSGQRAFALSLSERWQGILNEKEASVFDSQPALSGPGLPVYNQSDGSLIGISGQQSGVIDVVSMKAIQAGLPEMASAQ